MRENRITVSISAASLAGCGAVATFCNILFFERSEGMIAGLNKGIGLEQLLEINFNLTFCFMFSNRNKMEGVQATQHDDYGASGFAAQNGEQFAHPAAFIIGEFIKSPRHLRLFYHAHFQKAGLWGIPIRHGSTDLAQDHPLGELLHSDAGACGGHL